MSDRCKSMCAGPFQCSYEAGHVGHHGCDGEAWMEQMENRQPDMVSAPPHYTFSKVEPIDAIEAWGLGFCLGNCVKYVARSAHKGSELEDLKKARWYLERAIKNLEAGK